MKSNQKKSIKLLVIFLFLMCKDFKSVENQFIERQFSSTTGWFDSPKEFLKNFFNPNVKSQKPIIVSSFLATTVAFAAGTQVVSSNNQSKNIAIEFDKNQSIGSSVILPTSGSTHDESSQIDPSESLNISFDSESNHNPLDLSVSSHKELADILSANSKSKDESLSTIKEDDILNRISLNQSLGLYNEKEILDCYEANHGSVVLSDKDNHGQVDKQQEDQHGSMDSHIQSLNNKISVDLNKDYPNFIHEGDGAIEEEANDLSFVQEESEKSKIDESLLYQESKKLLSESPTFHNFGNNLLIDEEIFSLDSSKSNISVEIVDQSPLDDQQVVFHLNEDEVESDVRLMDQEAQQPQLDIKQEDQNLFKISDEQWFLKKGEIFLHTKEEQDLVKKFFEESKDVEHQFGEVQSEQDQKIQKIKKEIEDLRFMYKDLDKTLIGNISWLRKEFSGLIKKIEIIQKQKELIQKKQKQLKDEECFLHTCQISLSKNEKEDLVKDRVKKFFEQEQDVPHQFGKVQSEQEQKIQEIKQKIPDWVMLYNSINITSNEDFGFFFDQFWDLIKEIEIIQKQKELIEQKQKQLKAEEYFLNKCQIFLSKNEKQDLVKDRVKKFFEQEQDVPRQFGKVQSEQEKKIQEIKQEIPEWVRLYDSLDIKSNEDFDFLFDKFSVLIKKIEIIQKQKELIEQKKEKEMDFEKYYKQIEELRKQRDDLSQEKYLIELRSILNLIESEIEFYKNKEVVDYQEGPYLDIVRILKQESEYKNNYQNQYEIGDPSYQYETADPINQRRLELEISQRQSVLGEELALLQRQLVLRQEIEELESYQRYLAEIEEFELKSYKEELKETVEMELKSYEKYLEEIEEMELESYGRYLFFDAEISNLKAERYQSHLAEIKELALKISERHVEEIAEYKNNYQNQFNQYEIGQPIYYQRHLTNIALLKSQSYKSHLEKIEELKSKSYQSHLAKIAKLKLKSYRSHLNLQKEMVRLEMNPMDMAEKELEQIKYNIQNFEREGRLDEQSQWKKILEYISEQYEEQYKQYEEQNQLSEDKIKHKERNQRSIINALRYNAIAINKREIDEKYLIDGTIINYSIASNGSRYSSFFRVIKNSTINNSITNNSITNYPKSLIDLINLWCINLIKDLRYPKYRDDQLDFQYLTLEQFKDNLDMLTSAKSNGKLKAIPCDFEHDRKQSKEFFFESRPEFIEHRRNIFFNYDKLKHQLTSEEIEKVKIIAENYIRVCQKISAENQQLYEYRRMIDIQKISNQLNINSALIRIEEIFNNSLLDKANNIVADLISKEDDLEVEDQVHINPEERQENIDLIQDDLIGQDEFVANDNHDTDLQIHNDQNNEVVNVDDYEVEVGQEMTHDMEDNQNQDQSFSSNNGDEGIELFELDKPFGYYNPLVL